MALSIQNRVEIAPPGFKITCSPAAARWLMKFSRHWAKTGSWPKARSALQGAAMWAILAWCKIEYSYLKPV